MMALVGDFIVYIVRLKPLMYLYYVRYYKPIILVSRCKGTSLFCIYQIILEKFSLQVHIFTFSKPNIGNKCNYE